MKLHELAESKLGTDFTPDWIVSDEVSCAYAVSLILKEYFVDKAVVFPVIVNTGLLDEYLATNPLFERVVEPVTDIKAGDIVISPTGSNSRPDIMPHGHVGIYADSTTIMSNSSDDGLWKKNFTRDSWRNRYYYKGGFPVKIYRLKLKV